MKFTKSFENQVNKLGSEEQLVLKASLKAVSNSYSPYSHFKVGAALLLDNGELILGSNQENIAYPSGLCAERTALFSYGSSGIKSPIKMLAIIAFNKDKKQSDTCSPCGSCRQVMLEYEQLQKKPYKVIFSYNGKIEILDSSALLLPYAFHF
ncbi:MAG: cytidine deaminase [Cyclobacteriaceae bacterium]|nr:cytidine deaminase [Cyclobacteriaceae bacterium]